MRYRIEGEGSVESRSWKDLMNESPHCVRVKLGGYIPTTNARGGACEFSCKDILYL